MSVAYDGDVPGLSGTHYGGDGIGVPGWSCPVAGLGDSGASIIRIALGDTIQADVEYRLAFEGPIPAGVVINENGGGSLLAPASLSLGARIFADGVEL